MNLFLSLCCFVMSVGLLLFFCGVVSPLFEDNEANQLEDDDES